MVPLRRPGPKRYAHSNLSTMWPLVRSTLRTTWPWLLLITLIAGQSGPVAPDTVPGCTLFIDYPDPFTPQQGDTCATIAEYWDITERAFIFWVRYTQPTF